MRGCLVQISPLDPATNARVTVRAGWALNSRTLKADGQTWHTAISQAPKITFDFFDIDFKGTVQFASAGLVLNTKRLLSFGRDYLTTLMWDGAPISIWSGDGTTTADMTLEFTGTVTSGVIDRSTRMLPIAAQVSKNLIDVPLLNIEYGGTGGADGDAESAGQLKPACFGRPVNVPVFFFDQTLWIGQVDGYGNVTAIDTLYENAASFGPKAADYASYAALAAAVIPEGQWATCVAQGMIRLGANPQGIITCDPVAGSGTPGSMMQRWLTAHAGVTAGFINSQSFTDLDAALTALLGHAPAVSYFTQNQVQVLDRIQAMCAAVNATPFMGPDGRITVSRAINTGAAAITLNRIGGAAPLVTDWRSLDTPEPWWRLKAEAAKTWRVHSLNEIDYVDDLVDMGGYDPGETYREGQIVYQPADGFRYLYINDTPSSGHAPPNAVYWAVYQTPVDATVVKYSNGVPVDALRPAEANATEGAQIGPGGNVTGAVDANGRAAVDLSQSAHLNKTVDFVGNGATYGRPLLSRLDAGRPTVDLSEPIHTNVNAQHVPYGDGTPVESLKPAQAGADATAGKSVDILVNGSTYGRPLLSRLNAGRPTVDLSETIHSNVTVDYVPDGAVYGRLPLTTLAGIGTARRALIDFTQGHVGKNVDNLADGATFGRPLATRLNAGRPTIDLSEPIHINVNAQHVPYGDGTPVESLRPGEAGADVTANKAAIGDDNRVRFSRFEGGTKGWFNRTGTAALYTQVGSNGLTRLRSDVVITAAGQDSSICTALTRDYYLPANAPEPVYVGCEVTIVGLAAASTWVLRLLHLDTNGAVLSALPIASGNGGATVLGAFGSFVATSASAAFYALEVAIDSGSASSGTVNMWITRPIVCSAGVNQTAAPRWTPGPSGEYGAEVTTGKSIDILVDGATYGRPLFTRLNAGRPTIDLAEAIHSNVNAQHVPYGDGTPVESLKPAQAGADATAGKSVDVLVNGSTYGRTLLSRLSAGKPIIDFAESIHINKTQDNVPDGTVYARVKGAELSAGVPKVTVPGSGKTVGDMRNIPVVGAAGGRYRFTGAISYAASPTVATITVAAGSLIMGSVSIAYNSMTLTINSSANAPISRLLYIDANVLTAGAHSLKGVDPNDPAAIADVYGNDAVAIVGSIAFNMPSSGSGSGGGTGWSGVGPSGGSIP